MQASWVTPRKTTFIIFSVFNSQLFNKWLLLYAMVTKNSQLNNRSKCSTQNNRNFYRWNLCKIK